MLIIIREFQTLEFDAWIIERFVQNDNNANIFVFWRFAFLVFGLCDNVVLRFDIRDLLFAISFWCIDTQLLEIVQEAEHETIVVIVAVLVPGRKMSAEENVFITQALIMAHKYCGSHKDGDADCEDGDALDK